MKPKTPAHPTKFVQHVTVRDPDTGLDVELEIRKDVATGALVGLDGSYLGQDVGPIYDPYNRGEELDIRDDEELASREHTPSH
jgi:hypothetical protein